MGLFDRKPKTKQNDGTEKRSLESDYGYSYIPALSFLKQYTIGEPTSRSAVYSCMELISNSIAQIPLHCRTKDGTIVKEHAVNAAFKNSLMTRFMIIKSALWDCLLYGAGVIYIYRASDGTPTSFKYIPYNQYTVEYNELKNTLFFRIPSVSKGRIEPINVIYIVKNSKDGVQGQGFIHYGFNILNLSSSTDNAALDFFRSGMNINAVLKSSRPLTNQQAMDIKQTFSNSMREPGASVCVLGNDLSLETVGINASDGQLLETRLFNAEEICRFFNISPVLIGILDHNSFGTIEQANLEYVSHCLGPLISLLEEEFNRKCIKPSESGSLYIDFDEEHLLKADKVSTANYLSTLTSAGILSINNARDLLNLPPVDGGDKCRIPFSDANQNIISQDKNTDE